MQLNAKLDKERLSILEIINILKVKKVVNYHEYKIVKICNNSREVVKDSLFVAIVGYKTDGHNYIQDAIKNGVKVIVGEKDISLSEEITYIQVENSRRALAKLASRFFNYPDRALKLIGITGSAGKTSTSFMVDKIIKVVEGKTGLIGTLYTKIGDETYNNPLGCTTPDAITLNQSLAKIHSQGIDYVSMEVSSHALKLDRVYGIEYDIAIFTNLSDDHLNFHHNKEDYYQSKKLLFADLKQDKVAILNKDDAYYDRFKQSTSARVYSYGIKNKADITAENITLSKIGIEFELNINRVIITQSGRKITPRAIKLSLAILGKQNVYNALAAFLATAVLDISFDDIKEGLKSFSGVARRMELVYNNDFMVIDDFAHNPISLESNFKTLEQLSYNKLVIIHFLKGKRGVEANRLNAKLFSGWKDKIKLKKLITTTAKTEVINKNKVLPEEEQAFNQQLEEDGIEVENTEYLEEAINDGFDSVGPGDILLLLGGPGLDRAQEIIKARLN